MIRFLYTTDIHGSIPKCQTLLKLAIQRKINLLHLGADILPKGSDIFQKQKQFITSYFKSFYQQCEKNGIKILAFFGNDDLYSRKKYFEKFGTLLDKVPYISDGYEFKAYPYVLDYKFGNKTACKRETKTWRCPDVYKSNPVIEKGFGWEVIPDINEYFEKKGTFEDDFKKIQADRRTIIAIHQPPSRLGLDVCRPIMIIGNHWQWSSEEIRTVGSDVVFNWIQKEQPLLVLCGHIHESYAATGIWKAEIGKSLIIQPGQCFEFEKKLRVIDIAINGEDIKTELIEEFIV